MLLENLPSLVQQLNFTAIDFETANESYSSICSIGIVKVEDGDIVEQDHYLVKPPENRFNDRNVAIHGITEEKVREQPTFDRLWNDIAESLDRSLLLAHNADFERNALRNVLEYYQLDVPTVQFACTQRIAQEAFTDLADYRLEDVAAHLKIPLKHHNSLDDAIVSAGIGIHGFPQLDESLLDFTQEEITSAIIKRASAHKNVDPFAKKKISGSVLKQNLDVEDKENPFYDQKVVFTGDMESISRKEAASLLQSLGADVNKAVSRVTNMVIVGDKPGASKMRKVKTHQENGSDIRVIDEAAFMELIGPYNQ